MDLANASLKPSPWLYDFLKNYERFRPTAYLPTPKDVWTIGWGHTHGAKEGDTCDQAQALKWLEDDVEIAAYTVRTYVQVPLTQNQYDALVSLCFNIGVGNFLHSSLVDLLDRGHYALAAAQFPRWDRQAGKELDGLEKRRIAEMNHFLEAT